MPIICSDLYGDGDSLAFPVANAIVPEVEAMLLAADARMQVLPNASFVESISGLYCSSNSSDNIAKIVKVETVQVANSTYEALVVRPASPSAVGTYSYVLRYLGKNKFVRVMGPEAYLPAGWPGCHDGSMPGQNLCPVSCGRKMARGSGENVFFAVDSDPGVYNGKMRMAGYGGECHKYRPL